jgi:uncharacterized protein (DUF1015 family)
MPTIRAFDGRLVRADKAAEVAAPAHDAMTAERRREHAARHPATFLRVERTVGDGLTETTEPEAVLREGRRALEELLADGTFEPMGPAVYLYRLEAGGHRQTGVVAELSASDVASGLVRPHEGVDEERARHLARNVEVIGAQSSPILLGVPGVDGFERRIADLAERPPDRIVDAGDGVRQSVWVITDPSDVESLIQPVAAAPGYVVDGHHRVAATTIHARRHPEDPAAAWTLAVLYPAAELRVLEYNRLVADLRGLTTDRVLDRLRRHVDSVEPTSRPRPTRAGELGMRVGGRWYRAVLPPVGDRDVVARLDPTRLRDEILPAVFDIASDDPLGGVLHVGPNTDPDELGATADRTGGSAIVMHPLDVGDVFAVADAGRFLPPKSTYFAPKARSGIFLRPC